MPATKPSPTTEARFHLPYEPRAAFVPFHQRSQRFAQLVCHRRAGKTVACVADLLLRAMYTQKPRAQYGYIGPFRQQAKEVAWAYLKDLSQTFTKGPPRESELRVRLPNDATVTIFGADNPDSFRGMYFDGVIIDEFADIRPTLWNEIIIPALLDRGGWAVVIGTVKGKNHFHRMYLRAKEDPGWFSMLLKASESGILSDEALKLAREEQTEEAFRQEFECDWEAAIPGTYYAKLIADVETTGRVGEYAYDPDKPVYCAADIGFSDSTALWFWQLDEKGPILIDYDEEAGQPLSYYFNLIESKPFKLDELWLPHDAKASSFQTGRTTVEQFLARKLPIKIVPRIKVQHGIDAARMLLPRCRFDASGCFAGLEALRSYRRQYNERLQQYSDTPLHDWSSNGADAFRYFALATANEYVDDTPSEPEPIIKPPEYTLDQLFRDNDNWRSRIIRL